MLLHPTKPVLTRHRPCHRPATITPAIRPTIVPGRRGSPASPTWAPLKTAARVHTQASKNAGQQEWNPIEVVKREQGLQSNRLDVALRERCEQAIEDLRFRVTVGDVAARAGVKVTEADDALKALAYDAQAALEVSEQGDVVYSFPRSFRSDIQQRSVVLKLVPLLRGAQRVGGYLLRVAFGTALFFSVALVWFAIAVLMSSKDRDSRESRGGGYYNGYYGGYNGGSSAARLAFDLTDMFIYLDPNYGRTSQERVEQGAQMTFLEAIFSVVFGDGDPNAKFDEKRWTALGQLIRQRGGVITAEEMAPFLDPPDVDKATTGAYKDESFVLPALIRFGGEPVVDDKTGVLMYRFPSLQVSGVNKDWVRGGSGSGDVEVVQEQTWSQTAASNGQVIGVVALGLFNVVGVLVLSGLLADPQARYALMREGLGWIANLMPGLQAYAVSFFAIPAIRLVLNTNKNATIIERNSARRQALNLLFNAPRWLKEKLSAARQAGGSRTVQRSDVIFSSGKEAGVQGEQREAQEWDRRLRQSDSMRGRPTQQSGGQQEKKAGARRDFDGNWL